MMLFASAAFGQAGVAGQHESLVTMVTGSGPVVQGVLYLLILFSIASWGIILYKTNQIRSARRPIRKLHRGILGIAQSHRDSHRSQEMKRSPVAQVFSGRLPGARPVGARQRQA